MEQVVTFIFANASTQSWTAPDDCVLTRLSSSGAFGFVSLDPAVTAAKFIGNGSTFVDYSCLGNVGQSNFTELPKIPISKGRKIFVASSGVGCVLLHFEPIL